MGWRREVSGGNGFGGEDCSEPTVWDGDLKNCVHCSQSSIVLNPPCGMVTGKMRWRCIESLHVPSPLCGMVTCFLHALMLNIPHSSKPTAWDGDFTYSGRWIFTEHVLSPPCGMVTQTLDILSSVSLQVLSPPCGMETKEPLQYSINLVHVLSPLCGMATQEELA